MELQMSDWLEMFLKDSSIRMKFNIMCISYKIWVDL